MVHSRMRQLAITVPYRPQVLLGTHWRGGQNMGPGGLGDPVEDGRAGQGLR